MPPRGAKRSADAAPSPATPAAAKKAKEEADAFINAPMSPQMIAFCLAHPSLAEVAEKRDKEARAELGEQRYTLYRQGSYKVIKARALAPFNPDTEAHAAKVDKKRGRAHTLCSGCENWVADFNTRHKYTHGRNPAKQVICFVCCGIVSRSDKITVDEHLASGHMVFVNLDGRAGDLLRATQGGVFKSDHIGPGLARNMIKKQLQNLVEVAGPADAIDKSRSPALRKIAAMYEGKLPSTETINELKSQPALDLLSEVRKALGELDGRFEWEGIGGVEETEADWSDAEEEKGQEKKPEEKELEEKKPEEKKLEENKPEEKKLEEKKPEEEKPKEKADEKAEKEKAEEKKPKEDKPKEEKPKEVILKEVKPKEKKPVEDDGSEYHDSEGSSMSSDD